jgi:hypothetical protein
MGMTASTATPYQALKAYHLHMRGDEDALKPYVCLTCA